MFGFFSLGLVDGLVDSGAKPDEIITNLCEDGDRTRESSLSPEEYLGVYETKTLVLRAVTSHPHTFLTAFDLSSTTQ